MNTYVEAMDLMEKVTEPQLCSLEETRLHSVDNSMLTGLTIDLLIIFNDFPCLENSEML